MPEIRVTVLCVFLHEEKILVGEGFDAVKRETFYRPLGGGMEHGEHSTETIVREIKEEIGADITHPELLGVIENHLIYNGKQGHEIVFVYDAKFIDPKFYKMEKVPLDENGKPANAVWKPLSFFIKKEAPLYPDGLLELLMR